ncbi:hypothetical protein LCGC14_2624240 [marine sediment metagenome]|uniref:Uncharacterized protein n=1 Tax=marine sediment metagenome TaxID=412755 RepID=A0A0F9CD62_9ZZZZ
MVRKSRIYLRAWAKIGTIFALTARLTTGRADGELPKSGKGLSATQPTNPRYRQEALRIAQVERKVKLAGICACRKEGEVWQKA